MPKTVAIDFDGVVNTYTGWKGEEELFEPRAHVKDFLSTLKATGCEIVIYSTRPTDRLTAWLKKWELENLVDRISETKPPAVAYLDDRAVRFDGQFSPDLADQLVNFKPFWEK